MIYKTPFASYCLNDLTKGCKYCVKGQKLVLFITGVCSRSCFYCSLSSKRKNRDVVWANEKQCKNLKDIFEEVENSRAKGAGITGGDPLCRLQRTLMYAKALKKKYGKLFHIHIYLPTKLITNEKLRKLSHYIDEVRFHPNFLTNDIKILREEIEKVKLATKFWKKENIGIELPLLPDKSTETSRIIMACSPFIGFVNLNEFEISDTNFDYVVKHYKLNPDTYTIKGSIEMGLKIIKELEKLGNSKLKVHLCTARTKNLYQYKNRLKLRKILPFGFKTKEGSVKYFAIYDKNLKNLIEIKNKFKSQAYLDKNNSRVIISEKLANQLVGKYKIALVEELPTADSTPLSLEYL